MTKWIRIVLVVMTLVAAAAFAFTRIHERSGIVDVEAQPLTPSGVESRRVPVTPPDVPPESIREQITFYGRGDGICPSDEERRPRVWGPEVVSVGDEAAVCVEDFDPEEPVEVVWTASNGETVRGVAPSTVPNAPRPVSLDVAPQAPLGIYRVRASQGATSTRTRMRVVIAPTPFLRVRVSTERNKPIDIIVGGATPRSDVTVHIYRAWGRAISVADYYSTLTIATDKRGTGIVRVSPTNGYTFTCYLVVPGFVPVGWRDAADAWQGPYCYGDPP